MFELDPIKISSILNDFPSKSRECSIPYVTQSLQSVCLERDTASFGGRKGEREQERKERNLKVSFIMIREGQCILEVFRTSIYPTRSRNMCIWNSDWHRQITLQSEHVDLRPQSIWEPVALYPLKSSLLPKFLASDLLTGDEYVNLFIFDFIN